MTIDFMTSSDMSRSTPGTLADGIDDEYGQALAQRDAQQLAWEKELPGRVARELQDYYDEMASREAASVVDELELMLQA